MPRIQFPTGFTPSTDTPLLHLTNPRGHTLSIQPISDNVVRVVHQLPVNKFPQKTNALVFEPAAASATVAIDGNNATVKTSSLNIEVNFDACPRLKWSTKDSIVFMADSKTRAYAFDAASGSVLHYVERELYLPVSEDEFTTDGPFVHGKRNEFVYGLGESRGSIMKAGKKFTMEGRDALSYDWEHGDPLYKVNPFYTVYNKKTTLWHGIFYNNLSDSSFDLGAESDVLWGCFRVYKANCGPLDYYVILGDGTLPSVLSEYARLVSPGNVSQTFVASPNLPPLSQFGYLSSSLALAADPHAQDAIIQFLKDCRTHRFPVDGLHLSSGWCQDEATDDRNYFVWNRKRYPSPADLGRIVEKEFGVQFIVNIKPWLLEQHPKYLEAKKLGAFVQPPPDAEGDSDAAMSYVWAAGFASHKPGSYFDYSSRAASEWWGEQIKKELLANGLTGMWIDNNEMAGLMDDDVEFQGELGMYARESEGPEENVEKRMGWGKGPTRMGSVGKAIQTMGMARATYEAVIAARPDDRPVIVSRSGVPGIQAYAHGTWSGDNSTTWKALRWGTKMTLSVGMSFGPGLYGHDIGGFAGAHHPRPELLVRWCQNGAWHTRFTVHSWKETSTTMWMYDDVLGVTDAIRDALALRYRLAPTFYSLYVTDYYRNGWPVIKPLLWHHSVDPKTLCMDEEFLFGSHVLVAPVTINGATTRRVYLPAEANDGEKWLNWCEMDTGKWHKGEGEFIELEAPLTRTPVLVRSGGILVLGGPCTNNIYDGVGERTALVFPAPQGTSKGRFVLIEDDGRTNAHTAESKFTELLLSFKASEKQVEVGVEVLEGGYALPYNVIWFELPRRDGRKVVVVRAAGGPGNEGGVRMVDGKMQTGVLVAVSQSKEV
ncbi:Glycosyl hydrolases family 31-domain-containing protein [Mycena chlorophos]|uniref:Glycosyl hydrolases family 31-domain-containing protein n=1 Tax=Mycena chlorophos TaxID=658473 RepID=A0A8H6WB27_MYCCL|nr:Glycosyl hydrolases family 31-domain-containing protein [Mycena chlorophos]